MAKRTSGRKGKRGPDPETRTQPDEGLSGDPLKLAMEVYREVGGFRRFVEWAGTEKNIGVFYKDILLKMLAKAVEAAENGKAEPIIVRIENTAKE